LLAAAGGYRPGLGPFHSQTFESVLAHTPGLNVLFPSTASDAAGLLQAAFDAEEPTILLYPKIALNDPERVGVFDPTSHREAFGTARHVRRGDRLTIVSYGSTMPVVEHAAEWLEQSGASCDLFDLRSLAPWDRRAVIDSARRTGKLLVVHEDNRTCGLGAEIAATAAESAPGIQILRITRDDTYIPCNVTRHLDCLPSLRSVLDAAARLVGIRIQWVDPAVVRSENSSPGSASARLFDVEARGSSPADHTITVVTWLVELGQDIRAGQPIAELEAEKALFTLASPASGVVEELVIREGQAVPAGTVLARLRATDTPARALRSSSMEALPRLIESAASRPNQRLKTQVSIPAHPSSLVRVPTLLAIAAARGAQRVDNESLLPRFATRTASEIEKRTGIRARRQLAEGESLLDLAEEAATSALVQAGLRVHDLHALVLSTTTPPSITPSLACLLLERLGAREKEKPAPELPAHDLFAACTGYLYALAHAYDLCLAQPDARILVVTAEAMSRTVNPDDFDTSILFGDAATATLVAGPEAVAKSNDATPGGTSPSLAHRIRLHRPLVSARGEPGKIIHVPVPGQGHFRMDGLRVFAEAVKRMAGSLDQVCAQNAITPAELSLVIPHQANAKIIEEVRAKVGLPPERIASEIAEIGNSSSSSIPVVLADRLAQKALPRGWIGLTAFGGGFTFGSGLLEVE
jgi:2-oxoisovalerate dehydrogenase E1 component